MISCETVRKRFSYDPDTGVLQYLISPCSRVKVGDKAGSPDKHGYLTIRILDKSYKAHRIAWLHFYGAWPLKDLDHINGVKNDNRIVNLREVDMSTNLENQRRAHSKNILGLLGVSPKRKKYEARICIRGKVKRLGIFNTAEEAHEAYVTAKRKLHQACTI